MIDVMGSGMNKNTEQLQNIFNLIDPILRHGVTIEAYYENDKLCVDLNTQAKSGCVLRVVNNEIIAYKRYGIEDKISNLDDLLESVYDCCHGRNYFSSDWLDVFNSYGFPDPRGKY